jgi:VCBS repeat-containing protein
MFSVNATVFDETVTTGKLFWAFDSGSEAFDYLGTGQVLNLAYTVQVVDPQGGFANGTITVTIIGTNDAPVNNASRTFTISYFRTLSVPAPALLEGMTDPEGDAMVIDLHVPPQFGSLTTTADGGFEFIPAERIEGTMTFTVRVWDGQDATYVVHQIIVTRPLGPPPGDQAATFGSRGSIVIDDSADGDELSPISERLEVNRSEGGEVRDGLRPRLEIGLSNWEYEIAVERMDPERTWPTLGARLDGSQGSDQILSQLRDVADLQRAAPLSEPGSSVTFEPTLEPTFEPTFEVADGDALTWELQSPPEPDQAPGEATWSSFWVRTDVAVGIGAMLMWIIYHSRFAAGFAAKSVVKEWTEPGSPEGNRPSAAETDFGDDEK